jgi:hypothetical protein
MAAVPPVDKAVSRPPLAIMRHCHRPQKGGGESRKSPGPFTTIEDTFSESLSHTGHTADSHLESSPSRSLEGVYSHPRHAHVPPSIYTIYSGLRTSAAFPVKIRGCVPDAIHYCKLEIQPQPGKLESEITVQI